MLPVITIARQYGSGGHEVGEKLAQKLGIPFYDKALIAMAAKQSGLSEEVFANADEKATRSPGLPKCPSTTSCSSFNPISLRRLRRKAPVWSLADAPIIFCGNSPIA